MRWHGREAARPRPTEHFGSTLAPPLSLMCIHACARRAAASKASWAPVAAARLAVAPPAVPSTAVSAVAP